MQFYRYKGNCLHSTDGHNRFDLCSIYRNILLNVFFNYIKNATTKRINFIEKKITQKKARVVQFNNVNCDGNSNNIPSIAAG